MTGKHQAVISREERPRNPQEKHPLSKEIPAGRQESPKNNAVISTAGRNPLGEHPLSGEIPARPARQ